jgi:hypothetical protein
LCRGMTASKISASSTLPASNDKDIRLASLTRTTASYVQRCSLRGSQRSQTKPHEDQLVPQLADTWSNLIETFGRENVLIVSNSAGTNDDPGLVQASRAASATRPLTLAAGRSRVTLIGRTRPHPRNKETRLSRSCTAALCRPDPKQRALQDPCCRRPTADRHRSRPQALFLVLHLRPSDPHYAPVEARPAPQPAPSRPRERHRAPCLAVGIVAAFRGMDGVHRPGSAETAWCAKARAVPHLKSFGVDGPCYLDPVEAPRSTSAKLNRPKLAAAGQMVFQ